MLRLLKLKREVNIMDKVDKYLESIQNTEIIQEGMGRTFILLFVGYVVMIVLMAMKIDYDAKKVKEITTKLYPKIKKEVEAFEKQYCLN